MEQQIDIYNEAKLLEQTIVNLDSADITEKNKKLILKFQQYRRLQNMGKARARRYIIVLKHLAQYLNKDFDKAKKSDIERVIGIILQRDLAPPPKLVGGYYSGEIGWGDFEKKYNNYLQNPEVSREVKNLAEKALSEEITILCVEPTPEKCHRRLLAEECQNKIPALEIIVR